jgi:peptidyl-prolyl cis-trans isomerase C
MVPEFEVAAFSQEVEEVGDVIETKFGYHIIKVSEHQDAGVISFDEAKDRIIEFLSGQKKQEAVKNYLKELRDEATIEDLTLQPTEQPAAE